ncbi:MAG: hypothetical protein Kow0074_23880 [Candidatus Zixiibacteriota bacterium]
MLPILRDIRAVAGVTGVAILVKHDGRMERLFPAAFTDRHCEELQKLVTNAYQRLRGFTRLSLRYERVVVHLFNQPEFLLFATVLPDIEEAVFEAVVRSKLPAITRSIARPAAGDRRSTAQTQGAKPQRSPSPATRQTPTGDAVRVILDAFSRVTRTVGKGMGVVRAAGIWREVRDRVTMDNVAMAAVEVDPAGQFGIRKGRFVRPSAANIESLAQLWTGFVNSIGTFGPDAETEFFRCIEPYHDLLEYHGFFHFLKSHRHTSRSVSTL